MTSASSAATTLSVISKHSASGGMPARWMAASTVSSRPGSASWRSERLMLALMSGAHRPALRQPASCVAAVSMTHSPMGTISPFSSALLRKSPGPSMPRSGCCQRSRASTLKMVLRARSTSGW